jgi:hypothetical protein
MKLRFRSYRRKQGGRFYLQDGLTGKQESLQTTDRTDALRLLHARNEADHHPGVGLQIARAYARGAVAVLPSLEDYEKRYQPTIRPEAQEAM